MFSGDIHQSNLPSVLLEIPPVPLWLWILSLRQTINKWICTQTHAQLHTHTHTFPVVKIKTRNRVQTDPYGWTNIEGIKCLLSPRQLRRAFRHTCTVHRGDPFTCLAWGGGTVVWGQSHIGNLAVSQAEAAPLPGTAKVGKTETWMGDSPGISTRLIPSRSQASADWFQAGSRPKTCPDDRDRGQGHLHTRVKGVFLSPQKLICFSLWESNA